MAQYRKKPVVIEAFQWLPSPNGHLFWPDWFRQAVNTEIASVQPDGSVQIKTLEGDHRGDIRDWIIQGVKGELYPCKPDIFEALYDQV